VPQGYVPPPTYSIDAMRWGKGEGCGFITNSARDWPASYVCKDPSLQGCTYDNRMAAYCSVVAGNTVPRTYARVRTGALTSESIFAYPSSFSGECSGDSCRLPEMFQVRCAAGGAVCARPRVGRAEWGWPCCCGATGTAGGRGLHPGEG
jgi:hypothetical protein